jgi:demethylmenaquinone methyltransferase/2-methoxy-6-polyprenyl-1,4-benzoquinol methylase
MFDRIAGPYDAMNTLMTAGLHHRWRERAVALAAVGPGSRVIDIATGTGDLAIALQRAVAPDGEVIACDFSEQMLARARAKAPELRFEWADALALPYANDQFDAATVGFGARNFSDLRRGIEEMVRVVPLREPLASFFRVWFDAVVPALGRFAGERAAYSYLPSSVRRFPGPHELAALMDACGLRRISYVLTAGGIIAIHVGEVA